MCNNCLLVLTILASLSHKLFGIVTFYTLNPKNTLLMKHGQLFLIDRDRVPNNCFAPKAVLGSNAATAIILALKTNRNNAVIDFSELKLIMKCVLWVNCFITKTEVVIFRDLCSKNFLRFFLIVKTERERDERERALSPLASRFFRSALFLTRENVGGREYIVNDRGLGWFSVSRTRRT